MKHQTRIFAFLTAVLAMVSCARISPMEDEDMPISFGSYQYRATKADVSGFADGATLPDGSSFGVFAFFHEGTASNPGSWATAAADPTDALTNHPNFMLNQKVAKPGAEVKPGDQIAIRFGEHLGLYEVLSVAETVRKDQASSMYRIISEDESTATERNME